jgi:hypothetical protein
MRLSVACVEVVRAIASVRLLGSASCSLCRQAEASGIHSSRVCEAVSSHCLASNVQGLSTRRFSTGKPIVPVYANAVVQTHAWLHSPRISVNFIVLQNRKQRMSNCNSFRNQKMNPVICTCTSALWATTSKPESLACTGSEITTRNQRCFSARKLWPDLLALRMPSPTRPVALWYLASVTQQA